MQHIIFTQVLVGAVFGAEPVNDPAAKTVRHAYELARNKQRDEVKNLHQQHQQPTHERSHLPVIKHKHK